MLCLLHNVFNCWKYDYLGTQSDHGSTDATSSSDRSPSADAKTICSEMDAPTDLSDAMTDVETEMEVPHSSTDVSMSHSNAPNEQLTHNHDDTSSHVSKLQQKAWDSVSHTHRLNLPTDTSDAVSTTEDNFCVSTADALANDVSDISSSLPKQVRHTNQFGESDDDGDFERDQRHNLKITKTYGKQKLNVKEDSEYSSEVMQNDVTSTDHPNMETIACSYVNTACPSSSPRTDSLSVGGLIVKGLEAVEGDYNSSIINTVQHFTRPMNDKRESATATSVDVMEYTNLDIPQQDRSVYEDISDGEDAAANGRHGDSQFGQQFNMWGQPWEGGIMTSLDNANVDTMPPSDIIDDVNYTMIDSVYDDKEENSQHAADAEDKQYNESLPSMSAFQVGCLTAAGDGPYQRSPSSVDQFNQLPISCSLSTSPDSGFLTKSSFDDSPPELNRAINSLATEIGGPSYAMEFCNLTPSLQCEYYSVPSTSDYVSDAASSSLNWSNDATSQLHPAPYQHTSAPYAYYQPQRYNHGYGRYIPYPTVRAHSMPVPSMSYQTYKYYPTQHQCYAGATPYPMFPSVRRSTMWGTCHQHNYQLNCSDNTLPYYNGQQMNYSFYRGAAAGGSHHRSCSSLANTESAVHNNIGESAAYASASTHVTSPSASLYTPVIEDITPTQSVIDVTDAPEIIVTNQDTCSSAPAHTLDNHVSNSFSDTNTNDIITEKDVCDVDSTSMDVSHNETELKSASVVNVIEVVNEPPYEEIIRLEEAHERRSICNSPDQINICVQTSFTSLMDDPETPFSSDSRSNCEDVDSCQLIDEQLSDNNSDMVDTVEWCYRLAYIAVAVLC